MTNEQKSRIAQMKAEGKSYGEIAGELSLPRTTVSNFCLRNNLLSAPVRGNTYTSPYFFASYTEEPHEHCTLLLMKR